MKISFNSQKSVLAYPGIRDPDTPFLQFYSYPYGRWGDITRSLKEPESDIYHWDGYYFGSIQFTECRNAIGMHQDTECLNATGISKI